MKELLLLDADVIIDLYALDLFDKMCRAYAIKVTKEVLGEAQKKYWVRQSSITEMV